MFEAWGRMIYRRRRLTLVVAAIAIVFAGVWGTQVFGQLSAGNSFTPPGSQSQREADAAAAAFGRHDADVVVLYRSAGMTVADPAYRAAVTSALSGLPRSGVTGVSTYWASGSAALVSHDRHQTYAVLRLAGPATPPGRRRSRPSGATWPRRCWLSTASPPRPAGPSPPKWPSTARSPPTSAKPRDSPCRCC